MHENQSLFSLNIDPETKSHLADTAKWARFLAITGMVLLVIMALFSIVGMGMGLGSLQTTSDLPGYDPSGMAGAGVAMIVVTLIVVVVIFFPLLFLLRFANAMRNALAANDQETLVDSFLNLKKYFRFLGILTIIALVFYLLAFIIAIVGMSTLG